MKDLTRTVRTLTKNSDQELNVYLQSLICRQRTLFTFLRTTEMLGKNFNISGSTYQLVKDKFISIQIGYINAKNKGRGGYLFFCNSFPFPRL